jgi:tyrosyl-tRNA synthetase
VERYLKLFTFLRLDRIESALVEHAADPGRRVAQRLLAREVTATVHGEEAAKQAVATTAAMFGGGGDLSRAELPERVVSRAALPGEIPIVDLLVASGLASSKGEARRGIQGRGFYLNDEAIDAVDLTLGDDDLQGPPDRRFVILRKGKKNYVRLVLTD